MSAGSPDTSRVELYRSAQGLAAVKQELWKSTGGPCHGKAGSLEVSRGPSHDYGGSLGVSRESGRSDTASSRMTLGLPGQRILRGLKGRR